MPQSPEPPAEKLAFTVAEVAEMLGVGVSTLYRWQSLGMIEFRKAGKRTLILKTEVDRFLRDMPEAPASRARKESTDA